MVHHEHKAGPEPALLCPGGSAIATPVPHRSPCRQHCQAHIGFGTDRFQRGGSAPPVRRWQGFVRVGLLLIVAGLVVVPGFDGAAADPQPHLARVGDEALVEAAIADAAMRFDVPPAWIRAVILAESNGVAHATSPKGAIGLMQLMPSTWEELRVEHGLGEDPYAIGDNVIAGTAYLRQLLDRFGVEGFLAAYNAGPGRYREHLLQDRPLPAETLTYVERVMELIGLACPLAPPQRDGSRPQWRQAPLFAGPAGSTDMGARSDEPAGTMRVADMATAANCAFADGPFGTGLRPSGQGIFVSPATE